MTTQEDIDRYSENDCQFSYDEENEVYTAVLKNADGGTLEVEGDEYDSKAMAVAIEIAGPAAFNICGMMLKALKPWPYLDFL